MYVHQHDFRCGWCCQPVLSHPGVSGAWTPHACSRLGPLQKKYLPFRAAQNKSFYLNTVIFRPLLSEGPFCPLPLKQGRSLLYIGATYTNALAPNKGAYCTLVLCVFEAHGLQSGVIPIQVQIWMRENPKYTDPSESGSRPGLGLGTGGHWIFNYFGSS